MRKNRIIAGAIILSKGLLIFLTAFWIFLAVIVIHSRISPEIYSRIEISRSFEPGISAGSIEYYPPDKIVPEQAIMISNLSNEMALWLLIRSFALIAISVAIVLRIIKIIRSVDDLQTFHDKNIIHFRNMARLGFVLFILGCFNFHNFNGEPHFGLTIALGPLSFALACLVMSEIFKEGRLLLEDKNMII